MRKTGILIKWHQSDATYLINCFNKAWLVLDLWQKVTIRDDMSMGSDSLSNSNKVLFCEEFRKTKITPPPRPPPHATDFIIVNSKKFKYIFYLQPYNSAILYNDIIACFLGSTTSSFHNSISVVHHSTKCASHDHSKKCASPDSQRPELAQCCYRK